MPAQAQQLWLLLAPAAPLQWLGRTRPGVSVPRRAPGVITRQRLGLLPRDCLSSTLPAAPAEAMLSASRASARGENVWSPQIPVTLSQPTLYVDIIGFFALVGDTHSEADST